MAAPRFRCQGDGIFGGLRAKCGPPSNQLRVGYRRGECMDATYRVIREHKRSYEGIRFRCGEPVALGRRDTHWSSWLWCTTASGASAWVPEQLLKILDPTRAVVTTDYNSIELTVSPGELVTGMQVLAGWIWCQNAHDDEGWVPLGNLQLIRS